MTILNAAVVGPGGRARAHLPIIRILSDRYRLVAVCDVNEDQAKAVAAETGSNAYTDLEEMLDKEKLDVCLIATQAESHHVIAQILAERKVNIITETPIALTLPCIDVMIKSARENGVLLEVSENARRWPHERLKQKIVESGLIGDVREFYLSYTSGSYHGMAAVRAILGTEAQSVVSEFPDEEDVKERAAIEWSNGINGKYECNRARGNYWEIIGSKGALRRNELHLYEGDRKLDIITETVGEDSGKTVKRACVQTEPEVVWESPLQAYALLAADNVAVADAWCSLYDGVVHGKRLDYAGENARKDVELLLAIRESASEGGKKVAVPLTEITGHEELIHTEFEKVYGIDMLGLSLQHLKQKYTLPGRLKDVLYQGRASTD
ncbi:Gfo/Idh/MocA family protein [Candidatus Poribacteria bacterium]